MKIEYFQTIRKRDFEQNSKKILTAEHLVFLRPFPASGHIATAMEISRKNFSVIMFIIVY